MWHQLNELGLAEGENTLLKNSYFKLLQLPSRQRTLSGSGTPDLTDPRLHWEDVKHTMHALSGKVAHSPGTSELGFEKSFQGPYTKSPFKRAP